MIASAITAIRKVIDKRQVRTSKELIIKGPVNNTKENLETKNKELIFHHLQNPKKSPRRQITNNNGNRDNQ